MKQQDLFAHFSACKKVTQPIKKSCPNGIIQTPKRQPVIENYSKTFEKSKALKILQQEEQQNIVNFSQQTTELLAQLKQQQSTKTTPLISQSIQNSNNPTLRERYKELLKDKIELILPVSYKRLLKQYISMQEGIQMCIMRGDTPWRSKIAEYMERNCGVKLESNSIQQFMSVINNDEFKVKWGMNDQINGIDLIINGNNQNKQQFKQALLNIVKQYHQEFLLTLPKNEQNQYTDDCWHPKFDVHNIPNIPLSPLPENNIKQQLQSSSKHYQSVNEFIKANEIKNTRVKEILEEAAKAKQNNNTSNSNNSNSQGKSLGLSDALIAKIREKERLLNEQKQLQLANSQKGLFQCSDKERLKNVASIIKTYATIRKVSNIFFVQVIDYIISANKQYLLGKEQISQIIEKLIQICPYWLQMINHSQGKILRIEKTDISQILQEIDQFK